ncbi:MAG: hypothetical protein M3164_00695 [Actinomycetota bacterium]|nr:hypothetical protein [Actinomycetota bacterium]
MTQAIDDTLEKLRAGRAAAARHAWNDAVDLLSSADSEVTLSPEDLEALAEAAWWTGHPDDSISYRERAFEGYIEAGNREAAAATALSLAREYWKRVANAIAAAWLKRAERLLEGLPESPAHGYLYLTRALAAFSGAPGDPHAEAKKMVEVGTRFGETDLQAYGLQIQGMILVKQGHVEEGLALIDEATVAAVSGELSPMATGMIYCMTIGISRELADYRRAGDWTEAAKRWCERKSISGFPGVCRVHRAEIMALRGAWSEAEQEALRAAEELSKFNFQFIAADGFYEVGEIRLRMGDLQGAEDAFRQAHELGRVPQPGLALLRLAQGNASVAEASMRRALEDESWDRLARARLLPAQVEIATVTGDLETARAAAEELDVIAKEYGSPAIHASAECARGAVTLADGQPAAAVRHLRQACRLWQEVEVPYELARSRINLARAYLADGDADAAVLELQSAKSTFERLGAVLDLRRTNELLAAVLGGEAGSPLPTARETRTFMFTDIHKSTALVEAIGDEAWQDLLHVHDEILRGVFAEHGGEEIKSTGDGFFVSFSDPAQALEAASAIQQRLLDYRRTRGFPVTVRIGLHLAEATRRGGDYTGHGVHVAARVAALAEGGEILVSQQTLPDGQWGERASEAREVTLKGVSEPVQVVSIRWR